MNRNWSLWLGSLGCFIFLIIIILGPNFPGVDAQLKQNFYWKDLFNIPIFSPDADFPFGSDRKGVDMYSALIIGTRYTLLTVLSISIIAFSLALVLGAGAAHKPGIHWLLKTWNGVFSRIPLLFFVIFFATIPYFIFSPHRFYYLVGIIILIETGKLGEFVRKSILIIQSTDYFQSGVVMGTGFWGLFKWYYWPNCFSQWLSHFFSHVGSILFLLGQLGIFNIFLAQAMIPIGGVPGGLATYEFQNTLPNWATYLSNFYFDIDPAPWIPLSAAAFITAAMLSFHALSDGIRRHYVNQIPKGQPKLHAFIEKQAQKWRKPA